MADTIPFGNSQGNSSPATIPFGGGSQNQPAAQPVQPQQSLADSIWAGLAGYGKNIANQVRSAGASVQQAATAPGQGTAEGIANTTGALAGSVPGVAASFIPGGTTAMNAIGGVVNKGINFAANIGDTLATGAQKLGLMSDQQRANYDQNNANFANSSTGQGITRVAQVGQDAGNVANLALGAEGTAKGIQNTVNAGSDLLSTLKGVKYVSNDMAPPAAPASTATPIDEAKINDLYSRAIKPSVAGKSTSGQIATANSRVVTGLQAIADNRSNLSFTNADGETLSGATPKTVDELSQSIGQTKSTIFQQYDALAKQAGDSGVVVDGAKVGAELQPVIDSKSLAIANPKAIEYARSVQDRLTQAGSIDAQTAQDVIQHYNDSLKAFYRNPSYDTASQAGVDSLIANKFREQLDAGITGATGEQYGALKQQYGALASMEKDVARRAQVWARQNNVGLVGNIANVASGAELVRSLVTLNPADLLVSGAIKGIQKYMQYLNNPDVGVAKIFQEISKGRPPTGSTSGLRGAGTR